MKGTVIKNENGYFSVLGEDALIYDCKVRGRLKKDRYSLLVGDHVEIESIGDGKGTIERIIPRKNSLHRPYVANIDQVILTVAAHHPDINTFLLDELLVMIEDAEIPVVLCINKWDLHDEGTEALEALYRKIGYKVIETSTLTGEGVDELRSLLQGKITAFAGPSGVGKSSLLNAVEPNFSFQTGEVSEKTRRGRHTTRHASLYPLGDDSFIMDTPGFSALDFTHISKTRLASLFPEFEENIHGCRFIPCSHTHEPVCGVKEALESGKIAQSRYDNYVALLEDMKG